MGILTEWITEWLKGLLIEGIMGNLEGLFDTVNTRVGEISVQVGTTPAAWNAGVFSIAGNSECLAGSQATGTPRLFHKENERQLLMPQVGTSHLHGHDL